MPGIRFAEWLLRRTTTRENASTQLGDLIELSQTRSPLWFWRNILAAIAYAAFRPTLAFAAAFAASELIGRLWLSSLLWTSSTRDVIGLGSLVLGPLTLIPVFSLIRFGWHNTYAALP